MAELKITQREFELFRKYVYDEVGISLSDHKIALVQGRLAKRIRDLNMSSYREYYDYMVGDDEEAFLLISAISTNVTSFFREAHQWDFLADNLEAFLALKGERKLRIWSAACSSGEEPYSLAIFLQDFMAKHGRIDVKILATDISKKVLSKAIDGVYTQKDVHNLSRSILNKHFRATDDGYEVNERLKKMIVFRMFNLVHDSFDIFKSQFDIIFCRNVMIYFDQPTQDSLVSNYHRLIRDSGLLFVGHSESLTRSKNEFRLLKPAIYQKI